MVKEKGERRKEQGSRVNAPRLATLREQEASVTHVQQARDLVDRTRAFALSAIRFYAGMPRDALAQILGRQLLRSATSADAQYREAQWAKSISDFLSKTEGALQELDESRYWLELIHDSGVDSGPAGRSLQREATELVAIFVSITRKAKESRRTARRLTGR